MTLSQKYFDRAKRVTTGGVNSPVRAFKGVGGDPIFIASAQGAYMRDVDGNDYIDYIGSWGPMILGHCHPDVVHAAEETIRKGLSFGAPCVLEIELAERVIQLMPSLEKVRMVSSGTEATMTAIRLARGYTHRDKILKFTGCYHGHSDCLLAQAGSGVLTLGIPSTPGIPESITEHTIVAEYNDIASVEAVFEKFGAEIAAIIVEPIAGNMGMVKPVDGFLQGLRELCDTYQSLLIFDEVMTGFRVAKGGAQSVYDVTPDLTTLGKILGGGMPVGAIGGKNDIMEYLAPDGPVYQAGTLSGNPVAMATGLATLALIDKENFYQALEQHTQRLVDGFQLIGKELEIPLVADFQGGMFGFFFNKQSPVTNFQEVKAGNERLFQQFFHGMLKQGVYLAPSMYEAGFVSACHTTEIIDETVTKARKVLSEVDKG